MSSLSKNEVRRPIGIDLFAGAGGMSLGFEQAGFDVVAAVEIDPIHCVTHEFNFPKCKTICSSVVDLTGDKIRRIAGIGDRDVDVVFGGPPCQGFSMIGKRVLDDPRNQLVFHYVRLVSELKPKYVVFENVKGLTLGKHAQFLKELIESLNDAEYNITLPYQVLNAAEFGVPQDRRRLFVLGTRKGLVEATYPQKWFKRTTVAEAIGDLPNADLFDELLESDSVSVQWTADEPFAMRLRGQADDDTDFSYRRDFDPNILTSSLRTTHTQLSKTRFAETQHGKTEAVSRFRKLPPNGLCNTIRAGTDSARGAFTSPRPIHPEHPRVITVREAARLHSYPDWFRFHATKWHGFRQIGNSVPPMLARAVASRILEALHFAPVRPTEKLQLGSPTLLRFDMSEAAKYFGVPSDTIAQRTRKEKKKDQVALEAYG